MKNKGRASLHEGSKNTLILSLTKLEYKIHLLIFNELILTYSSLMNIMVLI